MIIIFSYEVSTTRGKASDAATQLGGQCQDRGAHRPFDRDGALVGTEVQQQHIPTGALHKRPDRNAVTGPQDHVAFPRTLGAFNRGVTCLPPHWFSAAALPGLQQ